MFETITVEFAHGGHTYRIYCDKVYGRVNINGYYCGTSNTRSLWISTDSLAGQAELVEWFGAEVATAIIMEFLT